METLQEEPIDIEGGTIPVKTDQGRRRGESSILCYD